MTCWTKQYKELEIEEKQWEVCLSNKEQFRRQNPKILKREKLVWEEWGLTQCIANFDDVCEDKLACEWSHGFEEMSKRSKFTSPICLNTLNFGIKLEFSHGFKLLKNRKCFWFIFKKIDPSELRIGINKADIIRETIWGWSMRWSQQITVYSRGAEYTVWDREDGSLCDFPTQQAAQNSNIVLLTMGILQWLSTSLSTLALGWPNLRCHIVWELVLGVVLTSETAFTKELEICVLEPLETEVTAESTLEFESKQVAEAGSLSARCGNM